VKNYDIKNASTRIKEILGHKYLVIYEFDINLQGSFIDKMIIEGPNEIVYSIVGTKNYFDKTLKNDF
jgi:hypothetical protein